MGSEYTFATKYGSIHFFLWSLMEYSTVRSHGHRQSKETRVSLLGLSEQHADFASLHPVCCEALVPGTAGDEYRVSILNTPIYPKKLIQPCAEYDCMGMLNERPKSPR